MSRGRRRTSRPGEPIRTCCVTRQRHPRRNLLRLVADGQGRVRVDIDAVAPGRGAWVCPERALLLRLEADPSPLKRSLRRKRLHAPGLLDQAQRLVDARVEAELLRCWRAGRVSTGAAALRRAPPDACILVSRDRRVPPEPPPAAYRLHLDTEHLGRLLGRGPRSIAVLATGPVTRPLRRWLQWQAALG
ncbi:MAG: DUF448 domain-containing protein [Deltaproteobacteria bacterium]|nr:MAG: DUF448 domain-containing protein [Deltaproteobacteria bacterium]